MKNIFFLFIILISSNAYALKPERSYKLTPEKYGFMYKELDVKTSDGIRIKAWFLPSQHRTMEEVRESMANPQSPEYMIRNNEKKPTIIICDGDAQNMSVNLILAWWLLEKGFNVVTFDWRGFGESDDWEINEDYFCYSEFLLDYEAVINETNKQPEVDDKKIGVYGGSTGAYLSFAIVSINNKVSCFAGRGLMTKFNDLIKIVKEVRPGRHLIVPGDYPMHLQPLPLSRHFNKPAFLVVGDNDDRTPAWMSQKIYSNLKGPKEIWIVEGATHSGVKGPENADGFIDRLVEFYNKYL
ncbi:MAG TPA: alpha/beta fold hydrolase [Cyclobacteriaceae bacterium]|nr:alpha/beta fold hydrolase [Cyclobacteriaceae bacterium]